MLRQTHFIVTVSQEIPREARDVVRRPRSGEFFTQPELDLLDRRMSECGLFLEILQDPLMPCMKYVDTLIQWTQRGVKCSSGEYEDSVGDAPSLPLIPNEPWLSPQRIKPLNPLRPTFLPQTWFTVVAVHIGRTSLRLCVFSGDLDVAK